MAFRAKQFNRKQILKNSKKIRITELVYFLFRRCENDI